MNRIMKSFLVLMLVGFAGVGSLRAQTYNGMAVEKTDGTNVSYALNTNGAVTFSGSSMIVSDYQGVKDTILVSDILKITFEQLLSIENADAQADVFVYPNPASDFIRIANLKESTDVSIYSIDGRMVWKGFYTLHGNIDLTSLEKGVYVLKADGLTYKFSRL